MLGMSAGALIFLVTVVVVWYSLIACLFLAECLGHNS